MSSVATMNRTPVPDRSGDDRSVARRFESLAAAFPDRAAIRTLDGIVTYAEFNRRANRIAHALLAMAGRRDVPVATLLGLGDSYLYAIFGALKAGHFYVPLDPEFPVESLSKVLVQVDPSVLIVDSGTLPLARQLAGDRCALLNIDAIGNSHPDTNPDLDIPPDSLAYIVFTSGSSGLPKGVFQNQRNLVDRCHAQSELLRIQPSDCVCCCSSPAVFGTVSAIFGTLLGGVTLFPVDVRKVGFAGLRDCLESGGITVFLPYVTMFRHFAGTLAGNDKFSSVRLIRLVGEAATGRDFRYYRDYFSASCELLTSFGSTEAGTVCARYYDKDAQVGDGTLSPGSPVPGVRIAILDEFGNDCPPGQIGEIAVTSSQVALGYWQREDLSRKSFVTPDADSGMRTFLTGDLGSIQPDGSLRHAGRRDFQVKIRGFRVELQEVELALTRRADIVEAIAVGIGNAMNETEIVAYYVPLEPRPVPQLRKALRSTLPAHMVPVRMFPLRQLPRTDTGKLNRALLCKREFPSSSLFAELLLANPESLRRQPSLARRLVRRIRRRFGITRPELLGTREAALAEIWKELLQVRHIALNGRFFEYGGNSLGAMEMQLRIENAFGATVGLDRIYDDPTLAELAAALPEPAAVAGNACEALRAIRQGGIKTPFFLVEGALGMHAPLMDHTRPLYQFNEPLQRRPSSYRSIAEQAEHYLDAMRRVQPTGPYLLGGYSYGGLVATEMAAQLESAGSDVGLLVIIDSRFPGDVQPIQEVSTQRRRSLAPVPERAWRPYSSAERLRFWLRDHEHSTMRLFAQTFAHAASPRAMYHRNFQDYVRPANAYRVPRLRCAVHLIVPDVPPTDIESKCAGWGGCTNGKFGFSLIEQARHHLDLFQESCATELVQSLEAALRSV